MHFGDLNNAQIVTLIASGQVSYHDTVYSTDWHETLTYDGVVFKSYCSCHEIGTRPICNEEFCPMVTSGYGTYIEPVG